MEIKPGVTGSEPNPEGITQFMLDELEQTRKDKHFFLNRFENLLDFYLKVLLAALSATLLILFQPIQVYRTNLALAMIAFICWGFGMVIFLRLCITRVEMVRAISMERRNKEYFVKNHLELKKYISVSLIVGNWAKWRDYIFTRQTVFLFYCLGFFISILVAVTTVFLMAYSFELRNLPVWGSTPYYFCWYLITSFGLAAANLVICRYILNWQMKRGLVAAERALKNVTEILPEKG